MGEDGTGPVVAKKEGHMPLYPYEYKRKKGGKKNRTLPAKKSKKMKPRSLRVWNKCRLFVVLCILC